MENWQEKLEEVTSAFKSIYELSLKTGQSDTFLFIQFEQGEKSFVLFLYAPSNYVSIFSSLNEKDLRYVCSDDAPWQEDGVKKTIGENLFQLRFDSNAPYGVQHKTLPFAGEIKEKLTKIFLTMKKTANQN